MKIAFGQKAFLTVVLFSLQTWNMTAAIGYVIPASNPGDFTGNTAVPGREYFMQFQVGSLPLEVTHLGVYDSGQDGLAGNIPVALLNADLSPVTSLDIAAGTASSTWLPGTAYRFAELPSSVILNANTIYTIYAQYNADIAYEAPAGSTAVLVGDTSITHVGSAFSDGGSLQAGTGQEPQFGAGTFYFEVVPEPSHYALLGMGFLAVVYAGRSMWLRRRTA